MAGTNRTGVITEAPKSTGFSTEIEDEQNQKNTQQDSAGCLCLDMCDQPCGDLCAELIRFWCCLRCCADMFGTSASDSSSACCCCCEGSEGCCDGCCEADCCDVCGLCCGGCDGCCDL